MKRSARFLAALLCAPLAAALLCAPAQAGAPAAPAAPERLDVLVGRETVFQADAAAGVAVAPLHELAAAVGAQVRTDGGRATVTLGAREVIVAALGSTAYANGESVRLPATPYWDGSRLMVPLRAVAEALGVGVLYDGERQSVYLTPGAALTAADVPGDIPLPVLMYHAVADEAWGLKDLFVRPAELERQLAWLSENGYRTVTFEDLPTLDPDERAVMLTFDDGYDDNYTNLFPLLKKYDAKATIFVISGSVGGAHMLTAEQIAEMSDSGLVSIQSHTVTHAALPALSHAALLRELSDSRLSLTRLTGREPVALAYPNGEYDDAVLTAAASLYAYGLRKDGGLYTTGDAPYTIRRIRVSRSTSLASFCAMVER